MQKRIDDLLADRSKDPNMMELYNAIMGLIQTNTKDIKYLDYPEFAGGVMCELGDLSKVRLLLLPVSQYEKSWAKGCDGKVYTRRVNFVKNCIELMLPGGAIEEPTYVGEITDLVGFEKYVADKTTPFSYHTPYIDEFEYLVWLPSGEIYKYRI